MKACKNHPDREAVPNRRLCRECWAKRRSESQRKHYRIYKQIGDWEAVNLPHFIHDAKNHILNKSQLATRYQITLVTVENLIKRHNITLKPEPLKYRESKGASKCIAHEYLDLAYYNVKPKNPHFSIALTEI